MPNARIAGQHQHWLCHDSLQLNRMSARGFRAIHETVWKENGAQGRNRTADTGIFNPLLYRLSYLGAGLAAGRAVTRKRAL